MPSSCALLGRFAIGARVALLWQHNANPSYKLASIPRYDDIVRTLGGVCARYWPVTGGWRGRSQHTAAWFAGFHWWRSGNITRTQYVSEYMLVLALCLVLFVNQISWKLRNGFASNSLERRVWSLAQMSLNAKVKGQRSRSPGTKMSYTLPSAPAATEWSNLLHIARYNVLSTGRPACGLCLEKHLCLSCL